MTTRGIGLVLALCLVSSLAQAYSNPCPSGCNAALTESTLGRLGLKEGQDCQCDYNRTILRPNFELLDAHACFDNGPCTATSAATTDMSLAASTGPCKSASSAPASCTANKHCYQNTTDHLLYWCTATNTWTAVGSAAAPVQTVFSRSGAVTAATHDYAITQIDKSVGGNNAFTGVEGTASVIQLFGGGTPATDDCAKFDANHNIVSAGGACTTSGATTGWSADTNTVRTNPHATILGIVDSNADGPWGLLRLRDPNVALTRFNIATAGRTRWNSIIEIPRSSYVELNERYAINPRLSSWFKVTTAGTTHTYQPVKFPSVRYNLQTLHLNGRVVSSAVPDFDRPYYYDVTSLTGGTCASDCASAGAACTANVTCGACTGASADGAGNSYGCTCTTGTAVPTDACWLAPSPACTFSDGNCTYTATAIGSIPSISDGSAVFARDASDAGRGGPAVDINADSDLWAPNMLLSYGDNMNEQIVLKNYAYFDRSPDDPTYGHSWNWYVGNGPLQTPSEIPQFSLMSTGFSSGAALDVRAPPVVGVSSGTQDGLGSAPQLPPTLTLAAGGSLTVGVNYCFHQAWMNPITGGVTPPSHCACIAPAGGNKKIVITPAVLAGGMNTFPWGTPQTVFYYSGTDCLSRIAYFAVVNNQTDTITVTDTTQFAEGQTAMTESFTPDPVFSLRGSTNGDLWSAGVGVTTGSWTTLRPNAPWSVSPAVPFAYHVTGLGCDNTCKNCGGFNNANGHTGTTEPTWKIDQSLFCDTNSANNTGANVDCTGSGTGPGGQLWPCCTGSGTGDCHTQYQKSALNGIVATAGLDNQVNGSELGGEFGAYALDGTGVIVNYRTLYGRPQYVCNTLSKPTCDASKHGLVWYTCGSPDLEERCAKQTDGSYTWRSIGLANKQLIATGQTANIGSTVLLSSVTAGRYRISCYVTVTTQATTSSTVPQCNVLCTDPTDSVAKTIQITPTASNAAIAGSLTITGMNNSGTGLGTSGTAICDAKAGTNINYSTTNYASSGATPLTYKVYVTAEAI